jgi:hypothetical protein
LHPSINIETPEEISDTLEKVDESVVAGANTDGRLVYMSVGPIKLRRKDTYRDENINTSKNSLSGRSWGLMGQILEQPSEGRNALLLTILDASPRKLAHIWTTCTTGVIQLINLRFPSRYSLNFFALSLSNQRTSSGELLL